MPVHLPVMKDEVLSLLLPRDGGVFLDCTVGAGGHARALLEAGASRVIGLDRDTAALAAAEETLSEWRSQVTLVHSDYRELNAALDRLDVVTVDGAVADLGLSSLQLEGEGRGFSFQRDEALDMRMDRTSGPTLAELLASTQEEDLAHVIFTYGEERRSRRVARAIVEARRRDPLRTTGQLAALVRRAVRQRGYTRIDPATRTFQALRIWVNRELEGLDLFLAEACGRLRPGARLVVIAFHSLEDRIVKHTFRDLERRDDVAVRVLSRKPLTPGPDEVARNPRSRSAKLRAVERVA
jgi:16S rRNA (cytosine1402-N4)-methyltransferase